MFFNLLPVFLESHTSGLLTVTLIAALAAVGGVIVSLIFNLNAQKQAANAHYTTIFSDTIREFSRQFEREERLEEYYDCERYAVSYLDVLDSLVKSIGRRRRLAPPAT